jgi:hypothetical protein
MKLNLISGKNQDGETCTIGWNFEAETEQEEKDLSLVRDHIFFGLDNAYPKYAGRQDNPESNLVKRIWYKIPENVTKMRAGEINCEDKEAVDFC